jgi:putative Mg2+ transporter-C (MgtC) family protein
MGGFPAVANAVGQDFSDLGDLSRVVHVVLRLLVAAVLGGLMGYQREKAGKSAGLRTHMLVTLGTALMIIVPQLDGMPQEGIARVMQGIVSGIGFLGAGAILKLTDEKEIHGLTTAAGIWTAAAIGIAAGLGRLGTAVIATLLALIVLALMTHLEAHIARRKTPG